MTNKKLRLILQNTVLGALYVALTYINPISSGILQLRISTLLMGVPFLKPQLAPGLILGVMIANIPSPFGWLDILGGFLIQTVSLYVFNRLFKSNYVKALAYGLWCGVVVSSVIKLAAGAPFWPTFHSVALSNILVACLGVFLVDKYLKPILDRYVD